jgi:hypothetical protein
MYGKLLVLASFNTHYSLVPVRAYSSSVPLSQLATSSVCCAQYIKFLHYAKSIIFSVVGTYPTIHSYFNHLLL